MPPPPPPDSLLTASGASVRPVDEPLSDLWATLSSNRPVPLRFVLLPSRRPNKALCPALQATLATPPPPPPPPVEGQPQRYRDRSYTVTRILDPEHKQPYISLAPLLLAGGRTLVSGLLEFDLSLQDGDYDVHLTGLEPTEALLRADIRTISLLDHGEAVRTLVSSQQRNAIVSRAGSTNAASAIDEGQAGLQREREKMVRWTTQLHEAYRQVREAKSLLDQAKGYRERRDDEDEARALERQSALLIADTDVESLPPTWQHIDDWLSSRCAPPDSLPLFQNDDDNDDDDDDDTGAGDDHEPLHRRRGRGHGPAAAEVGAWDDSAPLGASDGAGAPLSPSLSDHVGRMLRRIQTKMTRLHRLQILDARRPSPSSAAADAAEMIASVSEDAYRPAATTSGTQTRTPPTQHSQGEANPEGGAQQQRSTAFISDEAARKANKGPGQGQGQGQGRGRGRGDPLRSLDTFLRRVDETVQRSVTASLLAGGTTSTSTPKSTGEAGAEAWQEVQQELRRLHDRLDSQAATASPSGSTATMQTSGRDGLPNPAIVLTVFAISALFLLASAIFGPCIG
ncbi:uncharacterized protein PFL1_00485 [Pseudozyma flocculosa PF-1]|uniref:uncharacterized protein n=1 Tax=Pseudozyma flocculosa PF-1 TaxID=1277687 RepID=UPI00045615A4|nr:uncharacterized protein PFL1_00485 [Pseudozyma flocculosa PF-1]EPQ32288.1 hypothetical protein PFL1_00485 [Pseudozyma flocculosa PF-1]